MFSFCLIFPKLIRKCIKNISQKTVALNNHNDDSIINLKNLTYNNTNNEYLDLKNKL